MTVIKGCSELLLALGHPLMNDMKQPRDPWTGGGKWDDGGQVAAAHTRPSPVMSSADTLRKGVRT